jgi:hypothetical protein
VHELDELREILGRSREQEMSLRQRVRMLELGLEYTKREAARERTTFLEQEDAFLEELLSDHEREVRELRQRIVRASAPTEGPLDVRPTIVPPPQAVARHSADSSQKLAAVKLRSVRLPRPAPLDPITPLDLKPTPVAPRPEPGPAVRRRSEPTLRPSSTSYSLKRDQIAEETVQLERITSRPPKD